jgi:hypothetical protein
MHPAAGTQVVKDAAGFGPAGIGQLELAPVPALDRPPGLDYLGHR